MMEKLVLNNEWGLEKLKTDYPTIEKQLKADRKPYVYTRFCLVLTYVEL